ncbi:MAG: sensor domain-containing diguanylate cyclase [Lachnospiraceae bacterium]|nr:sensor domain-containing diguanylate cyclase [Lachnospiraceae bacterium]
MGGKKQLDAEALLEQIFYYMNSLVNEKDFKKTLLLLTDMGRILVNAERVSFWYWDKEKHQYWTLVASDTEQLTVPEGSGIVGATIEGNEIIVINDPYKDARFNSKVDKETGFLTKSILCMPVTNTAGEVIGAYQAINKLDENGESNFEEKDVKRLTLAAAYSGKTLESHLLYQAAHVDALTKLKNRRSFYEYYNVELAPVLQEDVASIVICDIDFFKKVNDTYGHNAGDAVLQMIGRMLQERVGGGEAFRWGGEEFVLLLPKRNVEQAKQLAEEIRQSVEQAVCHFEDNDIPVTMSFGVKEIDVDCNVEANIEIADGRLYKAKTTGRNRVVAED